MNSKKIKALVVFGTRPEAIKMAPVVKSLQKSQDRFSLITCVTGQHRQMLDQVLKIFEIEPDIDLDIMSDNQSLSSLTSRALVSMTRVLEDTKPDITLVQGDTTTAMVTGLASFYHQVPVGHVEAGLRTSERYDPFPEEINRRLLSTLSTLHFAPTDAAVKSLINEGFNSNDIYKTGNTVIDALLMTASRTFGNNKTINFNPSSEKYILVTAHRRENFGKRINSICKALKEIVKRNKELKIVYPVHLNPNINKPVYDSLSEISNIYLVQPLEYEEFVHIMKNAYIVLTDSGGIQEEAPALGKPVLVMRETTERPEAVEAGVAQLVGTNSDTIVCAVERLINSDKDYEKMSKATSPFGDGKAADKIVKILIDRFGNKGKI